MIRAVATSKTVATQVAMISTKGNDTGNHNGNDNYQCQLFVITTTITNGKTMKSFWNAAPLFSPILPAEDQAGNLRPNITV